MLVEMRTMKITYFMSVLSVICIVSIENGTFIKIVNSVINILIEYIIDKVL